ncbi:MAG: sensor histidine kinase [Gaiella sp.]
MTRARPDAYRSWLVGELVLVTVLGLGTLSLWATDRLGGIALPEARIALVTAVGVVASIVAVLAAIRFMVEGRLMDLLLSGAFAVAALGSLAFEVVPLLDGPGRTPAESWAAVGAGILATLLLAIAPFANRRVNERKRALVVGVGGASVVVASAWAAVAFVPALAEPDASVSTAALGIAFAVQAALAVVSAVGFGLRFRRHGRDLDSWLALAMTLVVFADLHYVLAPAVGTADLLQGDFLRLLSYGVLLVGVWRAISHAEFGRAVAEERSRVAQEIHDGLAQYLFAISTHVSMLENGAPLETVLPRLKEAATAAQNEARYAVLALSSAGGTAPFDAALRRYVEVLTADGALDVELAIDGAVRLDADEQIEIFRIVQEGLANARRHAGARRAWVELAFRGGRRVVTVRDDGVGFDDGTAGGAGQGLKSMRRRAAAIDGGFSLRSSPDAGTAIEIVLRAA